ncbi:hypothetical protein [Pseudoxanthomonas sp. z9]|uniref:hypothetical protein n=1 Tax=Pseudoxanthomonas sp. z9 TaxID=2584942 RepID=UPI001142F90E|nr:hypothetical protein [Pseudoxanthomonas sp. z9]MCL6712880.1 hypothetical protein [Pseudomonas sp. R2.Fl]
MHWLYLLFAAGALVLSMRTTSTALMVVGLIASLGLFIAWIVGWYAARMGDSQRDESQMIDPAELRRLRELAEARKQGTVPPPGPPPL